MTAVLNKTPPRWYEAWYRPDSSPFAWGICVIWILVFIAEQQFAVWPGLGLQPDSHTNTALGGLTPVAVEHGQIWRFFTNPFLHGGPNHLRSDILALIGVGATFQAIVGRAWFCASFALLALVSEAVSYLMLPNDSVGTIGPAGTVMGLLAANFVCGFHFEDPKLRQRIWSASLQSLIMALVATFQPQAFPVDIPNHVTGTIAGLLLGCGFLIAWRKEQAKPKFERIARNFSRIFGAMAVVGAVDTMIYYPGYVAESARHIPGPQRQFLSEDSLGEMSELGSVLN